MSEQFTPNTAQETSGIKPEIVKIQPSDITPDYLKNLVNLSHRTVLCGQNLGPLSWNLDAVSEKNGMNELFSRIGESNAIVHSHTKDGSTILPESDASASEQYGLFSPGIRTFLVTEKGILEYQSPKKIKDVRSWVSDQVEKIQALPFDEYQKRWNKKIHEAGFIKQEVDWEDTEKMTRLVSEISDLLSTPKVTPTEKSRFNILSLLGIRKN